MPDPARLTAWIQGYLDFCQIEKGLAFNTIQAYRADLEVFAGYCKAQGSGAALDAVLVARHLDWLRSRGLDSRSIARRLSTLRGFFAYLLREGVLEKDPSEGLKPPRAWQKLPHCLSAEQMDVLLEAPQADTPQRLRDRAMLHLLYASGLRVSELCQLQLSDVNHELGVVRVTGKGNKQRLVPVGRPALEALQAYLERGRPQLLKQRSSPYLFVTARG
ncbi:MAG: tyrosine-type recombinase/integrase, partial [Bryobacteraceae bacterium]